MPINNEQRAAIAAWRIGQVLAASMPAKGTVNTTALLDTSNGGYVLRAYRHTEREPVVREHAIITHVCARGLPAVAPLPLPDGAAILVQCGRFLARLHEALRSLPAELARYRPFAIDRERTLARIYQFGVRHPRPHRRRPGACRRASRRPLGGATHRLLTAL